MLSHLSVTDHTMIHRITAWLGLERTSWGHLAQPPCSSRTT